VNQKTIDQITKIAVQTALDYLEKEKVKQEKQKHDRRLRNIRLLLKNYRSLVRHCGDVKLEIDKLDEKLELGLLDSNEFAIESVKRSKKRTLAMVKFVTRMVKAYEKMCEAESEEALRRYRSVYYLYISDERKTAKEIATCHKTDIRTVYRDVNNSLEPLSVLMFGVDGLRFK
jgi:hypothetical protein